MSSLFVLDTAGNKDLLKHRPLNVSTKLKRYSTGLKEKPSTSADHLAQIVEDNDDSDDCDYFGLPPPNVDLSKLINSTLAETQKDKSNAEKAMDHVSELVNVAAARAQTQPHKKDSRIVDLDHSDFNELTGKLDDEKLVQTDVQKEMSKCTLPGVEKLHKLPMLSVKKEKAIAKRKRSRTKGEAWYNLPATEITEEVKNDLKILQMRSALDPKRFYKKNDLKVLPKYFQIGTVLHSPLDHYNERNERRNKKSSLVEELLADEQFQKFNKRKYNELMARREKYIRRKAAMKMKKLKKKK